MISSKDARNPRQMGMETCDATGILTLRPACPQHAHPHCSRGEGRTTKLLGPKRCRGTKGSLTQQTLLHLIGQGLSYFWFLVSKSHMKVLLNTTAESVYRKKALSVASDSVRGKLCRASVKIWTLEL